MLLALEAMEGQGGFVAAHFGYSLLNSTTQNHSFQLTSSLFIDRRFCGRICGISPMHSHCLWPFPQFGPFRHFLSDLVCARHPLHSDHPHCHCPPPLCHQKGECPFPHSPYFGAGSFRSIFHLGLAISFLLIFRFSLLVGWLLWPLWSLCFSSLGHIREFGVWLAKGIITPATMVGFYKTMVKGIGTNVPSDLGDVS